MIEPPWVGRRLYLVAAEKQSEATVDQVSGAESRRAHVRLRPGWLQRSQIRLTRRRAD